MNILSCIYPPSCVLCNAAITHTGRMCDRCFDRLCFIRGLMCDACGYPLVVEDVHSDAHYRILCASCFKKKPIYTLRSGMIYDDFSKQFVLRFKHGDRLDLAPVLSTILYQGVCDALPHVDAFVPIPLSRQRMWKRRYNQATLLAKGLAHCTKNYTGQSIPILYHALRRVRHTPSQGSKTYDQRRLNVQKAFCVAHVDQFHGRTVALVDDVYTSGATMDACARVLKDAGVAHIYAFTLARVLTPRDEIRYMPDEGF